MAGSGFSLGRLKREVDEARKGNQKLEQRNHELKKELRRVGGSCSIWAISIEGPMLGGDRS